MARINPTGRRLSPEQLAESFRAPRRTPEYPEHWKTSITDREWARYDRDIDNMGVDELRAVLKREGRIRAVHEEAGRRLHSEVSGMLYRLKLIPEGRGPRGASPRVQKYVEGIWRKLDQAHRDYLHRTEGRA